MAIEWCCDLTALCLRSVSYSVRIFRIIQLVVALGVSMVGNFSQLGWGMQVLYQSSVWSGMMILLLHRHTLGEHPLIGENAISKV